MLAAPFQRRAQSLTVAVGSGSDVDSRTGVDDGDYKPPFPFNGKLNKVTFNLGPVVLSEPERKAMRESVIKAKD